ncbi:MAG TPA: 30S ribosome-binding factor RbfA [Longimicrobiales bacterium]|nr:30S ribosome-binding factor RbfA [Longimicrobiales bacterium]
MAKKRVARLNEQLKRELTQLLRFEVKDPRIGLITINDVEVTPDLYHAKVFWTMQGSDEERDQALEGLRAASGFLRGELGRRMHIRRAPDLHFAFDNTLEHAMHIERLLKEARTSSPEPVDDDVASAGDAGSADVADSDDVVSHDDVAADEPRRPGGHDD